ncbi:Na+ dependent nucleoside transporter C-terminus-domain-containing protein [Pterulicium gracile]|uniref:Na+ dependent nucleoside transporter C-terminus-domain-containing protein n=1 Tax=Pterulicium gracile TaxID=1884261 RepID=A0A5C3QWE8_9AGAR|nr:Na+ dependent nucleoside transporter C-terminus-domain-containing protein [Pterula gracilis]
MHMVDPHSQIKTKSLQNRSLRTGIPPPAPPTMQSNAQQPSLEQQERTLSYEEKAPPKAPSDTEKAIASSSSSIHEEEEKKPSFSERYKHFIRAGLAIVILGWWISSTVLPATRPRWIVQTIWAWFFLLVIAFRYIPNSVVSKPVSAVWRPAVSTPWSKLPRMGRYAIGWLVLLGTVFGSAFGFPFVTDNTGYGDRAISVAGLFVFQGGLYLSSKHRSSIAWSTVIVGLFMQQVIAMFVLKTGAGFSIFKWISYAAADFLNQSQAAGRFFFDVETVDKHWFFVNVLLAIIFFIAFVQMMYYLGAMQWVIKHFAWFFFRTMNVSGAEAVIAAASPFVGQGESACLVKPYVDLMTPSEFHLAMTSGFSTIAGSVLSAFIALGVPPENLVTASIMSIPASISISKLRYPETEEPVTRGQVVVARGEEKNAPGNAFQAFSQGATFGLIIAGQILANVATILSLLAVVNGVLTWVGKGFGIANLTLELVGGYVFYPLTFFMGVPRDEILRVSQLLAKKMVANEFVAYLDLQAITNSDNPLSPRAYTIATYALCGFANISSLGIQIGVLGAMAPSRGRVIAAVATSAMLCGFLSTMQTAGIAGMLV